MQSEKNINSTVTAVGNSWVVCRSKSHSGHIYYFNTLTGQSVWNLSETEIQKAKSRDLTLENNNKVESYPEPQEPPYSEAASTVEKSQQKTKMETETPRIYNKQIINNQFSDRSFIGNPRFVRPQLITPPVPVSSAAFNPNVWAVPPAILISASPYATASQTQDFQVLYNNQDQTSQRFVNFKDKTFNNNKFAKNKRGFKNPVHKQSQPSYEDSDIDLRFKLLKNRVSKRHNFTVQERQMQQSANTWKSFNFNKNLNRDVNKKTYEPYTKRVSFCETSTSIPQCEQFEEGSIKENYDTSKNNTFIKNTADIKEEYCSDIDSDWLEDNIKVQGNKLQLDITSLKSLADPNLNQENWYIAVDDNILLGHLNFMNVLLNSDEDCKLMVPRNVYADIRESAADPKSKPRVVRRARRAVAFLSQHFDSNTAIIGEPSADDVNADFPYLIDCCLNLADENYFVILLSNNEELEEYKHKIDIPVFNIKELKSFLQSGSKDADADADVIVVSNEEFKSNDDPSSLFLESEKHNEDIESIEPKSPGRDGAKDMKFPENKHTADAVVQTEIIPFEIEQTTSAYPYRNKEFNESTSENCFSSNAHATKKTELNRRKIRLNRKVTTVTPPASNTDKKQFKWRRKRNVSCSQTSDSQSQTPVNKNLDSNNSNGNETNSSEANNSTNFNGAQKKDGSYTRFNNSLEESSETSGSVVHRSSVDKVTIDESSTSVISNSVSNVDLDMDSYLRNRSMKNDTSQERVTTNDNIFEVTDLTMEAHLETRCDEWISRFVQIMEEVLTQVLQRDNSVPNPMPPPWSIQEATLCVKIKFSDEKCVTDAATKLLNIVYRISDNRGRWKQKVRPNEFMELYTFGMYLVKSLRLRVYDCEDLDVAVDLLEKLMNDIRTPHFETTHTDNLENNYDAGHENTSYQTSIENCAQNIQTDSNSSLQENFENQTLNLQRSNHTYIFKQCNKKLLFSEEESPTIKEDIIDTNGSTTSNKVQPVIIRKFTVFPEYEKKLRSANTSSEKVDDSNMSLENYYSENAVNKLDSPVTYEGSDYMNSNNSSIGEKETSFILNEDIIEIDLNLSNSSIIDEIRETFEQVYTFCENINIELSSSKDHSGEKNKIYKKAQESYDCIENLIKSLNNIVHRETNDFENCMESQLGKAGFKVLNADIEKYRYIITKSIEQANILQEAVSTIMSAVAC